MIHTKNLTNFSRGSVKYIIGIDNGISGGIVVLDINHNIINKCIMPVFGTTKKEYDIQSIREFIGQYIEDINTLAYLERAQPQFRDGSKQAFKTGFGYGVMQGILTSLEVPFQIVAPKIWQKKVFAGLNSDNTKIASALFCKQKWPHEEWKATPRCKKIHDGLTDASCIAYYGLTSL